MKSFLRYPGGKSKHTDLILQYFKDHEKEYREAFIGGGSVYLAGYHSPNAWINDIDEGVYDVWRMVKEEPQTLIDNIERDTLILDHRRDKKRIKQAIALWKEVKSDTNHRLHSPGYRFLFLTKTCYSGVVTGGPTGGMKQTGTYHLTSRWAADMTIKRIREVSEEIKDCKITCGPWDDLVNEAGSDVALFLDPPYLKKGAQCYRHGFDIDAHEALAEAVVACNHRYIVTVDDCMELRQVWSDCGVPEHRMIPMEWKYSMTSVRDTNKVGKELFIVDEESLEIAKKRDRIGEWG